MEQILEAQTPATTAPPLLKGTLKRVSIKNQLKSKFMYRRSCMGKQARSEVTVFTCAETEVWTTKQTLPYIIVWANVNGRLVT